MALRWYAGYVYPPKPVVVDRFDVSGYALTTTQLQELCSQLQGCPITYEHAGIQEASRRLGLVPSASQTIKTLNTCANESGDLTKCPVGLVHSAFVCNNGGLVCCFIVNPSSFPRMCALIDSKALYGLSLSHLHGDSIVPLEVSVCGTPARPGCYVTVFGNSANDILMYKARVCSKVNTAAMEAVATKAPATTMQALLESLQPAERDLISAALNSFTDKIAAEETKNAVLEAEHKAMTKAAAVDRSMLESQVKAFLGAVGKSTASKFGLEPESCSSNFNSENPEILRRQIDRMLMCCNYTLTKRQADASDTSGAAAVDNFTEGNTSERPQKRKAVAQQIEPDELDAGAQLRKALQAI